MPSPIKISIDYSSSRKSSKFQDINLLEPVIELKSQIETVNEKLISSPVIQNFKKKDT